MVEGDGSYLDWRQRDNCGRLSGVGGGAVGSILCHDTGSQSRKSQAQESFVLHLCEMGRRGARESAGVEGEGEGEGKKRERGRECSQVK